MKANLRRLLGSVSRSFEARQIVPNQRQYFAELLTLPEKI